MVRHCSKRDPVYLLLCVLSILTFAMPVQSLAAQEPVLNGGAVSSDGSDSTIYSLGLLQSLGDEAIGKPVEVEGTVTFVDTLWKFMFIQDGEHAIFVSSVNAVGIEYGHRVKVCGTCKPGDLSPTILATKIIHLTDGEPPDPKPISVASLKDGDSDCVYVSLNCVLQRAVSSVGHTLYFCEQDGRAFHVVFEGATTLEELWERIGAKIQVEGVLGITLKTGTEDLDATPRNVKSIRIQCSNPPTIISPGRLKKLVPSVPADSDSLPDSGVFQLNGQVTHRIQDKFVLTGSPFKCMMEFSELHGFDIRNVVRVAGFVNSYPQENQFDAFAVEVLFTAMMPNPSEFQAVDPDSRVWEYVKANGRPKNIRKDGGTIKFTVQNDGQTAQIELEDDGATGIDLLRNTQTIEVEGTVMSCEPNGDCVIAISGSRNVFPQEPIVPVWKYIAWCLLPLTLGLVAGFFWVKSQRNRASARSDSINETHTRLVSAFTAISDGLLAVDSDQRVLSVNSAFCKFIDHELSPGDKVSASTFHRFLGRVKLADKVEAYLLETTTRSREPIEVLQISNNDQSTSKTFDLSVTAIEAPSVMDSNGTRLNKTHGAGRLYVLRDRTSERQLQAELIHANRIEAVGQLVGGIAHDFNNILTTITANLSLVEGSSDLHQSILERVTDAEMAANRGTDLVRRLLTYSGKTQLNPLPHSINETIRELYKFAGATFDARYVFQFDLEDSEPYVQADAGSIEQVILNLYLNARDAMPNGGLIATRTKLIVEGKKSTVKIWISDSGPGISPAIEKQIFAPFFTTKAGHAGAGLGLSISRRLVAEQNGELELQGADGAYGNRKGGCFVISLPTIQRPTNGRSDYEVTKSVTVIESSSIQVTQRKTVLVVDDEDAIRRVCTLILGNEGFDVLTANSGDMALAILEADRDKIDVVLLDMTMPGKSGLEVLKIASELYVDLPVVLCSGYLAGASGLEGIQFELSKPFSNDQLVNVINQALSLELA